MIYKEPFMQGAVLPEFRIERVRREHASGRCPTLPESLFSFFLFRGD